MEALSIILDILIALAVVSFLTLLIPDFYQKEYIKTFWWDTWGDGIKPCSVIIYKHLLFRFRLKGIEGYNAIDHPHLMELYRKPIKEIIKSKS